MRSSKLNSRNCVHCTRGMCAFGAGGSSPSPTQAGCVSAKEERTRRRLMQIEYRDSGDITKEDAVNTVNCVGVMGKGVALRFKKGQLQGLWRRPANTAEMQLGPIFTFETDAQTSLFGRVALYRSGTGGARCRMEYKDATRWRTPASIHSIAALGCGNGGLDWAEVRQHSGIFKTQVTLFEPGEERATRELLTSAILNVAIIILDMAKGYGWAPGSYGYEMVANVRRLTLTRSSTSTRCGGRATKSATGPA